MNVVITTRGKTHENTEGPWYDHVSFEGESSRTGSLSWVQTDATQLTNNSVHYCMLLDVVACCCAKFEIGQTFQPTTLNISFVP